MRLLLDVCVPVVWAGYLTAGGHEVRRWVELAGGDVTLGDPCAPDTELLQWAARSGFAIVTADTDFAQHLFLADVPSVTVIWLPGNAQPEGTLGSLTLWALAELEPQDVCGYLVRIRPTRYKITPLPIQP